MILYTYSTGVLIIHSLKNMEFIPYHKGIGRKRSTAKRVLAFIGSTIITALMVVVLLYSFAFFSFIMLAQACVQDGNGTPSQCANNLLGDIVRAPITVLMHE